MGLQGWDGSDERFSQYVEGLASVIGHADRANPLRDYCTGLMMPCARKHGRLRSRIEVWLACIGAVISAARIR
ncbi:MAG: hypothetical protein Q8K93_07530 [Reyranella sp.]|uniref:hypothetical protein n=1 Tax=Reyranella sp. TaxID=1929291 RepID=UPI0027322066|nr:hypothetical protein [Reyranella sp.]MDP1962034.1 hypothetical protein [Reyranella sp.]MDP2377856.1 hypothetical protein [Reyranella sp.]